jgi:branched-subunit amino acid ABC-type transport system permease component
MTLELFIQCFIHGLTVAGIFILIIMGLDLILRVTRILNFAHGQFYAMGAYTFWFSYVALNLNIGLAIVLTMLVLIILGSISYIAIFGNIQRRFTSDTPFTYRLLASAMASIGLMIFLDQATVLTFGPEVRGVPSLLPQILVIGNITIPAERLLVILISLLIVIGLFWFLFKTRLGKAMRAVSLDADVSSLLGINSYRVSLLSFIIGCAISGISGAMIAPIFAVHQAMGHQIFFLPVLIIMVGGIGSYKGAILGGLLVGLLYSFGYQFFGGLSRVFLFAAILVFIALRPGGLAGLTHD